MGSKNDFSNDSPAPAIMPDILIPYTLTRKDLKNANMAIFSVRPETNLIKYEAEIIKAVEPVGKVVYLANLSGPLINDQAIVARHYSSQLEFAVNGKEEMQKYPEMIAKFEKKFKVPFRDARIIGAYDAVLEHIKKDPEELFHTMVPEPDFLELYGQTIKKIDGFYVLNYDIPAVLTRHDDHTNIFVIAVLFKGPELRFADIDHVIYNKMCENKETQILDSDKRQDLKWYDQVRRTYHMSRSHIETMFDMTDYIFKSDGSKQIEFSETPLGVALLEKNILPAGTLEIYLEKLKENPLVYLNKPDGTHKLVNIIWAGKIQEESTFREKPIDECTALIEKINWNKSWLAEGV